MTRAPSLQNRTQRHYDTHPFDALTPKDERDARRVQPKPFLDFCDRSLSSGMSVAEIGCGPGRGTMYLEKLGLDVTAVDISEASLVRAGNRAPAARLVRATNLALPFEDGSFDAVISDGVIHHTPDAYRSFRENVRILRNGGFLYLGVYKRRRYYYYVYTYAGALIRRIERSIQGRILLRLTVIPVYYLAHFVKSRGQRTWAGATSFFYDYLITPQATFHTREEVEAWGAKERLELTGYDPSLGNLHVFMFRK
ncbi:MAG: class I SAM-dependent methyltransferase [Candidatus Acidiferrales bacterium]